MNKKQKRLLRRQRRQLKRQAYESGRGESSSMRIEASGLECPSMLTITADSGGEIELQAADSGEEGKPKVRKFSMLAYTGGVMRLNGFYSPVVVDLEGLKISAKSRPILRDHNPGQIVGHTTNIQADGSSIRLEGVLSAANEHAEEVAASADNGFPWQSSIGAAVDKMSLIDDGEKVTVNGRTFTGPLLVARKSTLREISFVGLGADDNTSARVAASANSATIGVIEMKFEQWLTAKGFKVDTLDDDTKASLQAMYDAEQKVEQGGETPPVEASGGTATATATTTETIEAPDIAAKLRAETAAELERQDKITEICASYDNPSMKINGKDESIRAMAIRDGWTTDRTELEALRESRPKATAGHAGSHAGSCTVEAMQGAMMLRAGLRLDDEAWQSAEAHSMDVPGWLRAGINDEQKQRAMEHAHRYSDMSLIDLCAEAVRMDGNVVPSGRTKLIEAAFSGSTLTNIFTTNVNTVVLATYMETGDTTGGWTSTTDVADFKTNERPRMTKGPDLEKLPPGGTADHVSRSDIGESYKIARYAKQFVIDEQDVINDRFNALMDMPREMGLAAARLRPDLVYAILLANAVLADNVTLFHANHGNLDTFSGLADTTLRAAITAIAVQQENGVNLNLRASHLIVPSDLKFTASQLINSSEVRGATGQIGTRNPLQDENLTMVSDSRLSNGVTDPATGTAHSGSVSTWFLTAAMAHTIRSGLSARDGTGTARASVQPGQRPIRHRLGRQHGHRGQVTRLPRSPQIHRLSGGGGRRTGSFAIFIITRLNNGQSQKTVLHDEGHRRRRRPLRGRCRACRCPLRVPSK